MEICEFDCLLIVSYSMINKECSRRSSNEKKNTLKSTQAVIRYNGASNKTSLTFLREIINSADVPFVAIRS